MIRYRLAVALAALTAASIAWTQPAAPKIILLVGPPGSGKTTQAKFLSKKYGIPAFSMYDLVKKQMVHKKDADSKALAAAIASEELLPDDAATNLIRSEIQHTDRSKGFILDGYPATATQAKSLDAMLLEQRLNKVVVVVLDAPDEVIRKRMLARKRVDDTPETVARRIQGFRKEAALLIGWAGKTNVVRVNANASISDVSKQIVGGLEDTWSKQNSGQ